MSAAPRLLTRLTWILLIGLSTPASIRAAMFQIAATTQATRDTPTDVTGHVLNTRTHSPVPRALVQFGSRRVLTDRDGVFNFPGVTETSGSLSVTKPGYFSSVAGEDAAHTIQFASGTAIDLPLYPEAILSGSVVDAAGEGLPRMNVIARNSVFDETGHHWLPSGRTQTDSSGNFRISLPAGDYAVEVRPQGRAAFGAQVLLPLSFPNTTSSTREAVHLRSGDQVNLQLRPETRRAYSVTFSADPQAGRRGLASFTARAEGGASIQLNPSPAPGTGGDLRVALPSGSYILQAVAQTQDGREQAETSVTVPDHDVTGVPLHFVRLPALPVVVELDPTATSDNTTLPPTPQQLGLTLVRADPSAETVDQSFSLSFVRDRTPSFSVPAGAYRLYAKSTGAWVITAATAAGTDLLTQKFLVANGMAATELHIRVSNQTAALAGTTMLGGYPGPAWIYLVAATPSATPLIILRSGADGSFSRSYLAPGAYRAVALEHRISADFQEPETLIPFLDRLQDFTIGAGDEHTLNLDMVPAGDIAP